MAILSSRFQYRWFWAGLLLIVLLGAIPRLLSYDFSLPYIDHPDEPNKYLGAQEWRGLYDSQGYYEGYPPGYVVIQLVTQLALEALGHPGMAPAVQVLRLVSILADLFTIVFIALTARLGAGMIAGLVAAGAWASAPLVIENNVYALPDPIIALLCILAIWLAANALTHPSRARWAVWSVIAGLIATLLKYSALPIIGPGFLAALLLSLRDRKMVRLLLLQAGIVITIMIWLFFIYGIDVGGVEREGATIRESGMTNVLQPDRVATNLYFTFAPVSVEFTVIVALGVVAAILARRRGAKRIDSNVALLCIVVMIFIPWIVSAYTVVAANYRLRDVLPATTAAWFCWG